MDKKPLFRGFNENHEFWESADHEIVILRCHEENAWTAHRRQAFQFAADTAKEAARRMGAALDTTSTWERKQGGFTLVPKAVAAASPAPAAA